MPPQRLHSQHYGISGFAYRRSVRVGGHRGSLVLVDTGVRALHGSWFSVTLSPGHAVKVRSQF